MRLECWSLLTLIPPAEVTRDTVTDGAFQPGVQSPSVARRMRSAWLSEFARSARVKQCDAD